MLTYDSTTDILIHMHKVIKNLNDIINILIYRSLTHDQTKLSPEEKSSFDKYTPMLRGVIYGSEEYKQVLADLGAALQHHYANNSHHPEHYPNGINGMSLMDIIEMFCDWKAASTDFQHSLDINFRRFEIDEQLQLIFENTKKELNW